MSMKQHTLLRILFLLIWILAITNFVAEYYYLYWTYRWLDIPMHFFGGVWVGLATLWLFLRSGYVFKDMPSSVNTFVTALVGGFCIGFLWEVYEYVVWQVSGKGLPVNYLGDTVLDLCMDLLGALFAYVCFALFRKDKSTIGESSAKTPV
jgi:hypothetical protein